MASSTAYDVNHHAVDAAEPDSLLCEATDVANRRLIVVQEES